MPKSSAVISRAFRRSVPESADVSARKKSKRETGFMGIEYEVESATIVLSVGAFKLAIRIGAQGGLIRFAQDFVPMLRIALLRFAPANPFARSLRSLGVFRSSESPVLSLSLGTRPLHWVQKKTAISGLVFWCPGRVRVPPWAPIQFASSYL